MTNLSSSHPLDLIFKKSNNLIHWSVINDNVVPAFSVFNAWGFFDETPPCIETVAKYLLKGVVPYTDRRFIGERLSRPLLVVAVGFDIQI